jgi:predicted homoserine dehydrogenase-like protein
LIIVDRALEARAAAGNPIRVGVFGAGALGRALANQIINSTPGMRLAAISNRHLDAARQAYAEAGIERVREVTTTAALEDAIARDDYAITDDPTLVGEAAGIDAVIEATGTVEHGARVTMHAIEHGKHVVLVNAELDGTLGPILKRYADRQGVVISGCDGDQPGAEMNLYRFVKGIGLRPLLCGNIKGLEDHYRTPATQEGFARKWHQEPYMVTSFADGTKISFEQTVVANATGMRVARRGMMGHQHAGPIDEMLKVYDPAQLLELGGIVDYVVGATPAPGVYVIATTDDPKHRFQLEMYKMGPGPLYCFYTPFHLCEFEVPNSVARAVLFNDATVAPLGGPVVDVVATAKRDLSAGEVLDSFGEYTTYGQCENADVSAAQRLLPIGLAEGCRLKRDVARDGVLSYDDVDLPPGRLSDQLREEQSAFFGAALPA